MGFLSQLTPCLLVDTSEKLPSTNTFLPLTTEDSGGPGRWRGFWTSECHPTQQQKRQALKKINMITTSARQWSALTSRCLSQSALFFFFFCLYKDYIVAVCKLALLVQAIAVFDYRNIWVSWKRAKSNKFTTDSLDPHMHGALSSWYNTGSDMKRGWGSPWISSTWP